MKRFLQKKIPIYFLIIAIGLLGLIVYQFVDLSPATKIEIRQAQAIDPNCIGKIELIRQKDFQLIKPLLMTELLSPSEDLKDLNRSLALEVNSLKSSGKISDASVYVRRLNSGEWTSVNDNAAYAPGSIIKIAAMITYLKMAEENPAMMKKKYLFQGRRKGVPNQTFNNDDPMVAGKEYSAKELLNRVIINSDNDATLIINESLDLTKFKKLFTDINIPEPDVHDPNFTISVNDLSKFLRVLYNSTYLNNENSEYAMSLLVKSSFTKGIVSGLPPNIVVAHKFGETGNGVEAQLHETGIVYYDDQPYLITIMTKGKSVQRLLEVLSDLSKITYDNLSKKDLSMR